VARALSRAQRADAALMILRRRSTLRSRNHLDQNYKPSLHHFIFDGGVRAQQSEAENPVDDEQAVDVWFLAVTIVEKRYSTQSILAICWSRAAPIRLMPLSYFCIC
jgi:hypothetical protein